MTMALPLSVGLMIMLILCPKPLMASYPSLVRFFILGALYFFKLCSIDEKNDASWMVLLD